MKYAEQGNYVLSFLMRVASLIRLGYRVAQALDNIHGLPAEYQEMQAQVVTALRENGKSPSEAKVAADKVIGDMHQQWLLAIDRVHHIFAANGIEATETEVKEAAWSVVKAWQYYRMKELGLPADEFEENNRLLRNTLGWNEREVTGLGGLVGRTMAGATNIAGSVGLPLPNCTVWQCDCHCHQSVPDVHPVLCAGSGPVGQRSEVRLVQHRAGPDAKAH